MNKLIASLAGFAMAVTLVSAASAKSSCQETADTQYAIAVEIGYSDADMVHEDAMADCLADSYRLALAKADETGACYIQPTLTGEWEVVQECDDAEAEADTMLAGPLAMLSH